MKVTAGGTAALDVELASESLKLETLSVTDSVWGQALAIDRQKTASGLVNIVSEETFNTKLGGNLGFTL